MDVYSTFHKRVSIRDIFHEARAGLSTGAEEWKRAQVCVKHNSVKFLSHPPKRQALRL